MVHQELSIVPDLTVAENVFLGTQPVTRLGTVDWGRMVRESREHLAGLGIDVDPRTRIGELPIGLQQLIEIARVLFSGARIIILDEPTSALSPPEVERLFGTLRKLKASGRSIVFISHFLDDILRISDKVTIFRNGRKVLTAAVSEIDKRQVIESMIGLGHRELEESYTGEIKLDTRFDAPVVMETDKLSFERAFRDVSLKVRAGEVLGIYGFMGCGQIELSRALFGKIRASGSVRLDGKPIRLTRTSDRPRGGHRLRAGEPARDALPPRAALQEHVDQHPPADLALLAQAVGRADDRQRATSRTSGSGRPGPTSSSAISPAATSRRWRWPSG